MSPTASTHPSMSSSVAASETPQLAYQGFSHPWPSAATEPDTPRRRRPRQASSASQAKAASAARPIAARTSRWPRPSVAEPLREPDRAGPSRLARETAERLEPRGSVAHGGACHEGDTSRREAEHAERLTPAQPVDRPEGEEGDRDPLQADRPDPGDSREVRPTAGGEREGADDEQHHHRVVVAASAEVEREEGVPAHERRGERRASGERRREHGGAEHREGGDETEEPGRVRGILACNARMQLGADREQGAVEGGRVAPRASHRLVGHVFRVGARRIAIGVAPLDGRDAPVHPVRPGVRREQGRAGERRELDGGCDRDHRGDGHGTATQGDDAADVAGKRERDAPGEGGAPAPRCVDGRARRQRRFVGRRDDESDAHDGCRCGEGRPRPNCGRRPEDRRLESERARRVDGGDICRRDFGGHRVR